MFCRTAKNRPAAVNLFFCSLAIRFCDAQGNAHRAARGGLREAAPVRELSAPVGRTVVTTRAPSGTVRSMVGMVGMAGVASTSTSAGFAHKARFRADSCHTSGGYLHPGLRSGASRFSAVFKGDSQMIAERYLSNGDGESSW